MNKKILAAAIAASIAAPMAVAADVTIYGKVHTSIDAIDTSFSTNAKTALGANPDSDNWQVTSRASRLGFKGSEDLGNGLKANFQMESTVDATDATGLFGGQRNTWVGLSGDFGEVRVGVHDTPAKVALYASGLIIMADTAMDYTGVTLNGTVDGTGTDSIKMFQSNRVGNAIAYISPNMSGLQFAAAIVPGEASGVGAAQGDGIADTYSLGAWYRNGGVKLAASYESIDDYTTNTNPEENTWGVYGSYTMDNFMIAAGYQDVSDYGKVRDLDKDSWQISATYTMGNTSLAANYGEAQFDQAGVEADYDAWGVGVNHAMSKRTSVYAVYSDRSVDVNGGFGNFVDQDTFSVGMSHSF